MSIELVSIAPVHEHRLRLLFSDTLGAGAFGLPAPAFYEVTCIDGRGASPSVQVALVVPNSGNVVELSLGSALVNGALYSVSAIAVPSADAAVTTSASVAEFLFGQKLARANVDPIQRDRDRLIYGIDLIWNGTDFQETATADLDRVSGPANVTKALNNAVVSDGLPWDDSHGGKTREFIDSPATASGTLTGSISAQFLKDPRVKSVKIEVELDGDNSYVHAIPKLISGEAVECVSITVPNE